MTHLFLPHSWTAESWWLAYLHLDRALAAGQTEGAGAGDEILTAYARLAQELVRSRQPDLACAIARALTTSESPFSGRPGQGAAGDLRPGESDLLARDLKTLSGAARRELRAEAEALVATELPPLAELAPALVEGPVAALRSALLEASSGGLLEALLAEYARGGGGPAALYPALRWRHGRLEGVRTPASASLEELVGLEDQLARLAANTEAMLRGRGAHNTLLYGPRGSGKSTAVRGLLGRYAASGLRLVELPLDELAELPDLLEQLEGRPQSFVLFVDDLSFEDGDSSYRPLRTLLEGGLAGRPANVALYATSNRRHLLKERFRDRPDPLDDDVHRWDSQHERLALADRFGLVITFPDAGQRRYLEVVKGLVRQHGIEYEPQGSETLDEAAIRFAEWGNGYSGRTAAQFLDTLRQRT